MRIHLFCKVKLNQNVKDKASISHTSFDRLNVLLDDADRHRQVVHEVVRDRAEGPSFQRPIVPSSNVEHVGIRELLVHVPLNERPCLSLSLNFDKLVRDFSSIATVQVVLTVLEHLNFLLFNFQVVCLFQVVQVWKVLLRVQGNKVQDVEDIRSMSIRSLADTRTACSMCLHFERETVLHGQVQGLERGRRVVERDNDLDVLCHCVLKMKEFYS